MRNSFGSALTVTLYGESHGEEIGAVLGGLAPGIKIDEEYINSKLSLRKASGDVSTGRKEADEFKIVSGVFNGYTTGAPLCITVKNLNVKSKDYSDLKIIPRPSHADYSAEMKYQGYQDYRGGGHFSGRCTVALVAVGAIVAKALEEKGVFIATHIKNLHGIEDRDYIDLSNDISALSNKAFPVLDEDKEKLMKDEILKVKTDGDSVGGVLETVVVGLPVGVGEPWFDSVESVLSHAMFSIPAVKGVEFGMGFGFKDLLGSEANDPFQIKGDTVTTKTNNNGGINGGITNGMPILFRVAVKPTPSIYKSQESVNLKTKENTSLVINGRHDPAIIHRARVVVDMMTALSLGDLLTVKFGTDYLAK